MTEPISSVIVPADNPSDEEFEVVFKELEAGNVRQLTASLASFRSRNPLPVCAWCFKKGNTEKQCTLQESRNTVLCNSCKDSKAECSWSSEVRRIEAVSRFPQLDPVYVERKYDEYRARNEVPKSRKRRQSVQDETENSLEASSAKRKRVRRSSSPHRDQTVAAHPPSASSASAYAGRAVTDIYLITGLDELKDHKYNNKVRDCRVMEESLKATFLLVGEFKETQLRLEVENAMLRAQLSTSARVSE